MWERVRIESWVPATVSVAGPGGVESGVLGGALHGLGGGVALYGLDGVGGPPGVGARSAAEWVRRER